MHNHGLHFRQKNFGNVPANMVFFANHFEVSHSFFWQRMEILKRLYLPTNILLVARGAKNFPTAEMCVFNEALAENRLAQKEIISSFQGLNLLHREFNCCKNQTFPVQRFKHSVFWTSLLRNPSATPIKPMFCFKIFVKFSLEAFECFSLRAREWYSYSFSKT